MCIHVAKHFDLQIDRHQPGVCPTNPSKRSSQKMKKQKLIDLLNGTRALILNLTSFKDTSPNGFEFVELDIFSHADPYDPVNVKWTTERCAVCRWVEDWDYNKIVICNR